MKIAVLGGSFDPPHNGHIHIAHEILRVTDMDEIWLMPVGNHPFAKSLSSTLHRLQMTQFLKTDRVKVSDLEIQKDSPSYTIETLQDLQNKFPENVFYWIIGSDQIDDFKKWKDAEKLLQDFNFIVYPRGKEKDLSEKVVQAFGFSNIPENIIVLESENVKVTDISSSEIREKIKRGENINDLVPEKIVNYIEENKFYKL